MYYVINKITSIFYVLGNYKKSMTELLTCKNFLIILNIFLCNPLIEFLELLSSYL